MKRLVTLFLLAALYALFSFSKGNLTHTLPVQAAETADQQALLGATLLITMTTEEPSVSSPTGNPIVTVATARGLGTVVAVADKQYIVTHNHWPLQDSRYQNVALTTAAGRPLLTMTTDNFRTLSRYEDPGTLILQLPNALIEQISPVAYATNLPPVGAQLTIVSRDHTNIGQAKTMAATIVSSENHLGQPSYLLESNEGIEILPGDSGGGVFWQGQLLGNTWERLAVTATVENRLLDWHWQTTKELAYSRAAGLMSNYLVQVAESAESQNSLTMQPGPG